MIIRYEGGNSGVIAYLEDGKKLGRDLQRDEIDHRVILSGDPALTDSIINSIKDKGQDRYERIVISFFEDDIATEKMEEIVNDYKSLLMSAYEDEEYDFYAEAHIPKVKHDIDIETGELIERKPHIHIVIPNKNLVTGGSLNPVGLAKSNTDYLDAIQETLNKKYDLVSPKDRPRSPEKPTLNRVKGDFFNERNQELKESLLEKIQDRNIRDMESFQNLLKEFGETRVYNKGKDNEYYGIKQEGEKRFTRLKNHFFSKEYIEDRVVEKTNLEKHYEKLVNEWKDKKSLEVRFIVALSKKDREEYKTLSDDQKLEFLNKKREEVKNEIGGTEEALSRTGRSDKERGLEKSRGRFSTRSNNLERLPPLQKRNVANGIRGYREESSSILQDGKLNNMEKEQSIERRYFDREMRWASNGRRRELSYPNQKITKNDHGYSKEHIAYLKKEINPDRFLSYCATNYLVNPHDHKVSYSKNGDPRYSVGKRNYNSLDFLTKHINLEVDEALDFMQKIHDDEVEGVKFNPISEYKGKTKGLDWREYNKARKEVYSNYKEERGSIYSEYIENLKGIKEKDKDKREVVKSFYLIRKKQEEERLKENYSNSVKILKAEFISFNKVESMEAIKKNIFKDLTNSVSSIDDDKVNTYEELLKRNRAYLKFEDQFQSGKKLGDYVVNKKEDEIDFLDQETKKTVFSDKKGQIKLQSSEIKMDDIKALMQYAHDKYNGKLKLSGSKEFKTACALACSQLGLNVILKPNKYHDLMMKENSLKDIKSELTTGRVVTDNLLEKFSDKNNDQQYIDKAMELAEEKIKEIHSSLDERGFSFDQENSRATIDGKDYDLPKYIDNENDAKNYSSYLLLDTEEITNEIDKEIIQELDPELDLNREIDQKANDQNNEFNEVANDSVMTQEEPLMTGQDITYSDLKEISEKENIQDHLLKIAKNLDDSSKEVYQDEINRSSRIFEATEKIHASNRVKEAIFNDSRKDKSDIAYVAKEISSLSTDMRIKGRLNYKDGQLSVNSFKDKNKENIGLSISYDSKENKGEAKINGNVYEFKGVKEFQQKMQDIRMNIERNVKENERSFEMDR